MFIQKIPVPGMQSPPAIHPTTSLYLHASIINLNNPVPPKKS